MYYGCALTCLILNIRFIKACRFDNNSLTPTRLKRRSFEKIIAMDYLKSLGYVSGFFYWLLFERYTVRKVKE